VILKLGHRVLIGGADEALGADDEIGQAVHPEGFVKAQGFFVRRLEASVEAAADVAQGARRRDGLVL
jgi:hypothetical protein